MKIYIWDKYDLEAKILERVLENEGYEVQSVNSIQELNNIEGVNSLILILPPTEKGLGRILNNLGRDFHIILIGDLRYLHWFYRLKTDKKAFISNKESIEEFFWVLQRYEADSNDIIDFLSKSVYAFLKLKKSKRQKLILNRPISNPLSSTEIRIMVELTEGKSGSEIAATLFRSLNTINTHKRNIKEKLGLKGGTGLTAFSARNLDALLTLEIIQRKMQYTGTMIENGHR